MPFDPSAIAKEFSILRSLSDKESFHYLDNAAMAQVPDFVIDSMAEHDRARRSNVRRGLHRLAEEATDAYETARARVARYLGVKDADEVVFTNGTTAGINILAQSLGHSLKPGDEIVLSQLEHHSNIIPWQILREMRGISLSFIPISDEGHIDLDRAEDLITDNTKLVAVTHGSNVTGAITDVTHVARLAHHKGSDFMLDGAQVAPLGPLNLEEAGVDFYVFSGHKAYGPTGIGVLWGRKELLQGMEPAFGGGEMIDNVSLEKSSYAAPPHRFEAGTPPVTQAVGLAAALDWIISKDLDAAHEHLSALTERIIHGLSQIGRGGERIRILGPSKGTPRLPLVSFAIEGIHPHDVCQLLNDRYRVALRGGYHCAQPLHDHWGLDGSTRASLAMFNNMKDVDALLNGLEDCIKILG
jgi:cysteine desulfurase/selenocysteine lyase